MPRPRNQRERLALKAAQETAAKNPIQKTVDRVFDDMTKSQLIEAAQERGLEVSPKMKKAEILEAFQA